MMAKAVLFDLGGTLAEYFTKWTPVLRQSISEAHAYLAGHGLCTESVDDVWPRVEADNHEARNYRVRPLEKRLQRIFRLPASTDRMDGLCRAFMGQAFAMGKCYPDSVPVLRELRANGLKLAIVSNLPWGSPAYLWHDEIRRLGLHECVDEVVTCTDVGWRKPASPIFRYALDKLEVSVEDAVFVGDDPRWDLVGPRRIGMDAVIISRESIRPDIDAPQITDLHQLPPRL
jgi:putative hydrolase of the HAD superfamily